MKRATLLTIALLLPMPPALANAAAPVPVTVATATVRNVPIVREGLGTVQALNAATIRVQVSGQLDDVAFKEGQRVAEGQLLAQIDPRPFQATLDQAVATLARDKATLANAKLNLSRTQPLATRGYATNQTLDTQSSIVVQDESTLKIDEAQIAAAKVQLDFTHVVAPFDGVVGIRLIDVGNVVHPSDPSGLVVLTQVQPISVIFTLPSADIPAVQAALAHETVGAVAYGADDKSVLDHGTLLLINNEANPSSGTVQLKAQFPNAANTLWPGTFVNVHIVVETRKNGVTVPLTAVQQGPVGLFLYVVDADDIARMRPVTVAQSRNRGALLDSGLQGGERVVTDGQYALTDGAKVAIVTGAAARQVQSSTTASAGMLP